MLSLFGLTFLNAQDWVYLKHFKDVNEKLSLAQIDENRAIFMENSITIGWLNLRPEFFRNKPYSNRGISRQTTPQMLVRFRQNVINLKPNVLLLAGSNDIADNTGPSYLKNDYGQN